NRLSWALCRRVTFAHAKQQASMLLQRGPRPARTRAPSEPHDGLANTRASWTCDDALIGKCDRELALNVGVKRSWVRESLDVRLLRAELVSSEVRSDGLEPERLRPGREHRVERVQPRSK